MPYTETRPFIQYFITYVVSICLYILSSHYDMYTYTLLCGYINKEEFFSQYPQLLIFPLLGCVIA